MPMKISALRKLALAEGIEQDAVELVYDDDDPKKALVSLLIEVRASKCTKLVPTKPTAAEDEMREQLSGMKQSELRRKAAMVGVEANAIDDAGDEDDPKTALITLILAVVGSGEPAAAAETKRQAELTAELAPLKLSQLRRRALTASIDADAIEEAGDADDPKAALIDLLVKAEVTSSKPTVGASDKPHFGNVQTIEAGRLLFGKRHIMLSYCHACCQDVVKKIHAKLFEMGMNPWMDIDNGMNTDIFDSMAAGVQNAAAVVCFMSKKYENSSNCALELKFAQQSGVPLVPVMMQESYSAGGWLGILTAGALWVPLHAGASFDEGIELLIRQIFKNVISDEEDDGTVFSIDDVKGELARMRSGLDESTVSSGIGVATIPAAVQSLPVGLRISAEMRQLLSNLLSSDATRVGFHGMGGIGKTVC